MKIVAFSTAAGAAATLDATGVMPFTFPPLTADRFDPDWLAGCELIYVHLHGMPDQPYWYGDQMMTAIRHEQIEAAQLNSAIVFVANCYGANSRMVQALYQAGASAVIAGPGKNFTVEGAVRGADLLGKNFIGYLKNGLTVEAALAEAKNSIRLRALLSELERDALEFTIQSKEPTS
jgi:hypothetical protein